MVVNFRPSKSLVPLTEAQMTPGPSGKTVTSRHVFYNKAMVMEYGHQVTIRPKGARALAFDNPSTIGEGLYFTKAPVVVNYSDKPTFQGLQMAVSGFFSAYGKKETSDAVEQYGKKVSRAAGKAAHMINVSMPSDGYAQAVASRITEALSPVG